MYKYILYYIDFGRVRFLFDNSE